MAAVFEHSPDAIFIEDTEGFVLDVNPAACVLHGMPREELVGKHVLDLVPESERELVAQEFPGWPTGELKVFQGFSYNVNGVHRISTGMDSPFTL